MLPLKTFFSETEVVPILRSFEHIGGELIMKQQSHLSNSYFSQKIGTLQLGTEKLMSDLD